MDLSLRPESVELAATGRSLIARHLTASADGPDAASGPLWDAAVTAGWLDVLSAAELEPDRLEAAICLLREVGRAQAPVAIQVGMVSRWLACAVPGLDGWQTRLTEQPARRAALCWPLAEPRHPVLRLSQHGAGYRADGDLGLVREAAAADELLASAELDGRPMLVAIPLQASGVSVTPVDSVGGLRQAHLRVAAALLTADDVTAGPDRSESARVDALLLILDAAELVGCAEMALEMTVHHAQTRHQFGRPLGAFQAVRHRIADMTSNVEQSRWLLYRSAELLACGADPAPALTQAHALALWNSVALDRVLGSAHQVHGGVGFIRDHPLHRYFGRQKASMFSWGQPADHAESVLAACFGTAKINA